MYDDNVNLYHQQELERLKIKFITEYIGMSIHTGASLLELVQEAKEAWIEIIK